MDGFRSQGWIKDRLICYKYDLKNSGMRIIQHIIRPHAVNEDLKARYSKRKVKNLLLKEKLAIAGNTPSWFYTSFDRRRGDPLTNYSMDYIGQKVDPAANILITGCGVGITTFHIADCGFKDVTGVDLLPEAITICNKLKEQYCYNSVKFIHDDCLNPKRLGSEKYDVITALSWVYSAAMGNYGNPTTDNPFNYDVRMRFLLNFFSIYEKIINQNGLLFIELIDAVTDYRLADDHPSGEDSQLIYPVRYSPEMVDYCGREHSLKVIDKKMEITWSHHPRTLYILKKECES